MSICGIYKFFIEKKEVLISLLKCDTLSSQMARSMAASVSMGLPVEERDPLEIDFYQRRNLIFTTIIIWKLILTTLESVSFFFNGNEPITLTFHREIK